MIQTDIQTGVAENASAAPAPDPVFATIALWVRRILKPVASLKVTVVLFVFSLLLVFFGTLAQKEMGILSVVDQYFWSVAVWVPARLIVKFGQIFLGFPTAWSEGMTDFLGFPLLGGKTLALFLFVNLLAAHIVRFKLSWKRSGILLTHGGLILMLAGEFVTRNFAVEGMMPIPIGGSSNVVTHMHVAELVVIDSSSKETDQVTVVPASKLRRGQTVRSDLLPFDVQIQAYYKNSVISDDAKTVKSPENSATAGNGLKVRAIQRRETTGTDQDQKYDMPAAYVKLTDKDGNDLGTYLVAVLVDDEKFLSLLSGVVEKLPEERLQTVKVGDKTYGLGLRFKRTYEPFAIRLDRFKHDVYLGTDMAKNYQSDIRLDDAELGVNRELTIKMNDPLRHREQAFYQSGVLGNDAGTILQVVRNPGWRLPYASCIVVALGLLVHFGITLNGYLERRAAQ